MQFAAYRGYNIPSGEARIADQRRIDNADPAGAARFGIDCAHPAPPDPYARGMTPAQAAAADAGT